MSDIKLFTILGPTATELTGRAVELEKSLQTLMEQNLELLLGVRLLASEYSTGKTHAGRIDSLGIDEDGSPVIIEYKRSLNENVINQGLFYLDWLLDHQAEFELLVMKTLGDVIMADIDWLNPRLICIAGDFNKYDEHAVQQINRNIGLVRYKKFADNLLMLELVNAVNVPSPTTNSKTSASRSTVSIKTVEDQLKQSSQEVQNRVERLKAFMLALEDDVQIKITKHYFAFTRLKHFACLELNPTINKITIYLKNKINDITLEPGFTRDVTNIGHYGTGSLEVVIDSDDDVERAKPLIIKSYETS